MLSFLKAAPRGMLIAVAVAFIFLNGLGVWQLYRLHWKEGLIADLARTEAMPAVPVDTVLDQPKPSWRTVSLPACRVPDYIPMHSELDGAPGYRTLAACPLPNGQYILVDMGFAHGEFVPGKPLTIDTPVGRLRPFEKAGMVTPPNHPAQHDWYWRSADEMGRALGHRVRGDYFIVLDLAASHWGVPSLVQGPVTAPLPNRHLEYAMTWFSLAWIMIGMFIVLVRQKQADQKQVGNG